MRRYRPADATELAVACPSAEGGVPFVVSGLVGWSGLLAVESSAAGGRSAANPLYGLSLRV